MSTNKSVSGSHYVITMDSDLAHHPKYILQVLKIKNTANIILGSRYIKKNSTPGWPKFRIFLSKSAHFFFRIIYKSNLDSTNAFRLYNLKSINSKLNPLLSAQRTYMR